MKNVHLVGIIGVHLIYAGFHKKSLLFVLTRTYLNKEHISESAFYPIYLQVFGFCVR